MNCIASVIALKDQYQHTWRNRPDWFWFWQFLEEVVELGLALAGLHRHAPDYELRQIAAIAINWMEKRDNTRQ